jgi:hypothetical protein
LQSITITTTKKSRPRSLTNDTKKQSKWTPRLNQQKPFNKKNDLIYLMMKPIQNQPKSSNGVVRLISRPPHLPPPPPPHLPNLNHENLNMTSNTPWWAIACQCHPSNSRPMENGLPVAVSKRFFFLKKRGSDILTIAFSPQLLIRRSKFGMHSTGNTKQHWKDIRKGSPMLLGRLIHKVYARRQMIEPFVFGTWQR